VGAASEEPSLFPLSAILVLLSSLVYCLLVPNGQLPEPSFRKFVMPVASSSIANDIKKYSTFLERELKTDYSRIQLDITISIKHYESPLDGGEKKLAFFFGRSVKDHPPT
jgi:hypothetical protein